MTEETFEASLRDVEPGTMILPQFHGESLLHHSFSYFLKRYRDLELRVSIPVSAGAGSRYIPDLVAEGTPVYVLIVSIDGFLRSSHETRRGSIALARAEDFAKDALAQRGGRRTPLIAVRWVEGSQSEIEFERYLAKWLFEEGVDFVLRSRLFSYGSKMNSEPMGQCHSFIEGNPVVLFNGDVLLCERVADRSAYVLGNVNECSWSEMMARRRTVASGENSPCKRCSAAYLLSGFKGVMQLRHPRSVSEEKDIFVHSDHSQTFYSLTRDWTGINWSLRDSLERSVPLETNS